MVWQSDKQNGRTFDAERHLDLVYQSFRDAASFAILCNGEQVAYFAGGSEGRDLTEDEKRDHPGFDSAMIWHVHSRGGRIEDPDNPGQNLDSVIIEALTSFQALYGTAGFRDGRYLHALVEVRLGSYIDTTQ